MIYNIGQKLVFKEDTVVNNFSKDITIKKGTEVFVGADRIPMTHFKNECVQPLPSDSKVKGYSVSGIAEWIYEYISKHLQLDDALDGYDISVDEFKDHIAFSLEELGMYDHEGNTN